MWLEAPVHRVEYGDDVGASGGVLVTYAGCDRARAPCRDRGTADLGGADRLPPGACRPMRDQLTQRMPAGAVIKCMAIYDHPFWRDDGLNGQVASNRRR